MANDELKNAFRATVEASLEGLRTLADVLNEEAEALGSNNPAQLEQAVARKVEALQRLEPSIQAREQIQAQCQFGPGLDGGEQFVRHNFSPKEMLAPWKELVELAVNVDSLNTRNGKLAVANENQTRQALNILTGRTEQANTYNKGPATKRPLGGYSLGKC